jgi:hypothetical protein
MFSTPLLPMETDDMAQVDVGPDNPQEQNISEVPELNQSDTSLLSPIGVLKAKFRWISLQLPGSVEAVTPSPFCKGVSAVHV